MMGLSAGYLNHGPYASPHFSCQSEKWIPTSLGKLSHPRVNNAGGILGKGRFRSFIGHYIDNVPRATLGITLENVVEFQYRLH